MLPERDSTIVLLGNSITAYGEWTELLNREKIFNRGIPGDHCDGVRERLNEVARLNPEKLFLMIGINDLAYHPPETVTEKYENLVAALRKKLPSTTLYLQSVFPVNNSVSPTPIENRDVRTLNLAIKKIAEKNNLTFLDTHPVLVDESGNLDARYTMDGIHLNGHAYLKWRDFLLPYISDHFGD